MNPNHKEKGPQVLADLTGTIQITTTTSISQSELNETIYDGDLATKDWETEFLRRCFTVDDLQNKWHA